MKPLRATYGFINHGHGLIDYEGESPPPAVLSGLTDKPGGHIYPGDKWWPAFNCGAIDSDWWAIWCTVPDEKAPRGGMVKTSVLLWHLNDLHLINDITPYIYQLLNDSEQTSIPINELSTIFDSLSSIQGALVVDSPSCVPQAVSVLWPKLWLAARQELSVRMAFQPPQSISTCKHPTFYVVPKSLANQWHIDGFSITSNVTNIQRSRATDFILDINEDLGMEEVISQCHNLPGSLSCFGELSRLADNLGVCRANPTYTNAIAALRTTIACAPETENAESIKKELLTIIKRTLLLSNSPEHPLMLSNICESNVTCHLLPAHELSQWVALNAPSLRYEFIAKLFSRVNGNYQQWWKAAVLKGLFDVIESETLAPCVITWLKIPEFDLVLNVLKINKLHLGNHLFELNRDTALSEDLCKSIEVWAQTNACSTLYALSALHQYKGRLVFDKHISTFPSDRVGIEFLISNVGNDSLGAFINDAHSEPFLAQISEKVLKNRELLNFIDLNSLYGLKLWSLQFSLGGSFYPPGINEENFSQELLKVIPNLELSVLPKVVEKLMPYLIDSQNREDIWKLVNDTKCEALATTLINCIAKDNIFGFTLTPREAHLNSAFIAYFEQTPSFSSQLLISFLAQCTSVDEQAVIQWISKVAPGDWSICAISFGQIIKANKWSKVAEKVFSLGGGSYFARIPDLRKAVDECAHLLSPLNQCIYRFSIGAHSTSDKDKLTEFFAEVCSRIAYDRLEYYWKISGGELGQLKQNGTPQQNWLEAAQNASSGMLPGGLVTLIEKVRKEFPHNEELKTIQNIYLD